MPSEVFCMSEYYHESWERGLLSRERLQGASCHLKILCISAVLGIIGKANDDRGNATVWD